MISRSRLALASGCPFIAPKLLSNEDSGPWRYGACNKRHGIGRWDRHGARQCLVYCGGIDMDRARHNARCRSRKQQLLLEGRCARCTRPRLETGTAWYCRSCADAMALSQRVFQQQRWRNPAISCWQRLDFEEFCRLQQERFSAVCEEHIERIYECRELWTRQRLTREGSLEIRK